MAEPTTELERSLSDNPRVLAFCRRHGILAEARLAIDLVKEAFPFRSNIEVRVGDDPEEAGEWLVVDVAVPSNLAAWSEAYDQCVNLWVQQVPTNALSLIRLINSFA